MTYVLYGWSRSGSLAVEMALAEIELTYKVHDVDLAADAQREAQYAAVNPQRKLPTLVTPTGEVLTESAAILLTLDERYPQAGLLPPIGSSERARALRFLLFVASELYPLIEINDYPDRFSPSDADCESVRELARQRWRERWLLVEQGIESDPFLLPSGFCLTDLYIAVVSRWAQQTQWRSTNLPRIERLTQAVSERPKLAAIWRRHQSA